MHHDPYRRLYGEKESNAILESIDLRSSIKFQTFAALRSIFDEITVINEQKIILDQKKIFNCKSLHSRYF